MPDQQFTARHHDSFLMQFAYFFIKLTLGTLVRTIWVKKVYGIENIPKTGSLIIVFNHQSFFDFLCFISISPRKIHFLTAEKFFSHILWSPLVRLTSQIKVERGKRDKRDLHALVYEHLEHDKVIGIFPEGTRSPDSDTMLYAFTGAAKFAIRKQVPVLPVGIKGTYDVMAKHDKKPKFKKIVTIHIGELMHFTKYSHTKLNKKAFRILTDKIMIEISKLSGKNYPHLGRFT